jgi:hypothetical protein
MYIIIYLLFADDEIYKKKRESQRERQLKAERSVYTFTPVMSTAPRTHNYYLKRANRRLSESTNFLNNTESITNLAGQSAVANTVEEVDFWRGRGLQEGHDDLTAASSITGNTEKSIKSVEIGSDVRATKMNSTRLSSSENTGERGQSALSYYAKYLNRQQQRSIEQMPCAATSDNL